MKLCPSSAAARCAYACKLSTKAWTKSSMTVFTRYFGGVLPGSHIGLAAAATTFRWTCAVSIDVVGDECAYCNEIMIRWSITTRGVVRSCTRSARQVPHLRPLRGSRRDELLAQQGGLHHGGHC